MKAIFGSLSPNVEKDDALLALKILFQPWRWKKGKAVQKLEEEFSKAFPGHQAFAFNSGRSALLAILQGLSFPHESQVLVSGFTCNAAVNPVLWSHLKPQFVDIQENLNISLDDLKGRANQNCRAILAQHTFGLPLPMNQIEDFARRRHLIIIEDVAHALGGEFHHQKLGTFGQAAFFSSGRDKVISSVAGGLALTADSTLAKKIKTFQKKSPLPSYFWIAQQLFHPILTFFIIMPAYPFWELGRWILLGLQKTHILSKAVSKQEKRGEQPKSFPQRMPNALAILALHQWRKLNRFNNHRAKIAKIYDQEIKAAGVIKPPFIPGRIYLKYPLILRSASATEKILRALRKKKIFLYDGWQNSPIVPSDTSLEAMAYTKNLCPQAEKISQRLINLPTHINVSVQEAHHLASLMNKLIAQYDSGKNLPRL